MKIEKNGSREVDDRKEWVGEEEGSGGSPMFRILLM
jgi:hypothetical protein